MSSTKPLTSHLPSYFVTGTDTEVGKTLLACALIHGLQHKSPHSRVSGFKPVVAGTYIDATGQRANEDLLSLTQTAQLGQLERDICPYILDTPAAPHLVAKALGLRLSMANILDHLSRVQSQCEQVVLEGAGGFLVPLNEEESLSDLAALLKWPVVLVVGMRLGCLNHALASVEAIKSRGIPLAGWVANTIEPEMGFFEENLLDLQSRIKEPFLGLVPQLPESLKKTDHAPYSNAAIVWAASHLNFELL